MMSQANNISGSAPAQDPFVLLWFLLFFIQPMISGSVGADFNKIFVPKSPKPRSLDDRTIYILNFSFVRARRVEKHPQTENFNRHGGSVFWQ